MKIACLSMDDPSAFVIDDPLAHAELRRRGIAVDIVPWRRPSDWSIYDLVIIRTPWDYQDDPQTFVDTLRAIERSGATLCNPLSVVQWNLTKTYLRDLAAAGLPIVPTRWFEHGAGLSDIEQAFSDFGAEQVVVKPLVSANADHTYWLQASDWQAKYPAIDAIFRDRPCMTQPFVETVLNEGEWSLFYFDHAYSHAIRKLPKPGDFRVQEEHGAEILAADAPDGLRSLAVAALDCAPAHLLYARVDFLMDAQAGPLLIELELIEPSLYFRMHADAPRAFVDAVEQAAVASNRGRVG